MRRLAVILMFLMLASSVLADEVKKAEYAGNAYPKDREMLSSMLQGYLDDAKIDQIPPNIIALIAPHAGYIYSGSVTAYAFKAISNLKLNTIIVVAFNHRKRYDAISVYDRGSLETPYGLLKVNKDIARELIMSHDKLYINPEAFVKEHSAENMLPFISHIFGNNIKIVPILIGYQSYENSKILGDVLSKVLKDKENVLIIGSTDMSHFRPYKEACDMDQFTIDILKKLDDKLLREKISSKEAQLCGRGAVLATLIAAKGLGADNISILKYANSMDTVGKKDKVVGYLSAALYKEEVKAKD